MARICVRVVLALALFGAGVARGQEFNLLLKGGHVIDCPT